MLLLLVYSLMNHLALKVKMLSREHYAMTTAAEYFPCYKEIEIQKTPPPPADDPHPPLMTPTPPHMNDVPNGTETTPTAAQIRKVFEKGMQENCYNNQALF